MAMLSRRPAGPPDLGWARQVHHRAYRDAVVRQFGTWDDAKQDRFFSSDWARGPVEILLCDGVPCGYHTFTEFPDRIDTGEIVIDPDFQNRGIGTWVVQGLIDRGRMRGVVLNIGALHQNRSLSLYRRLGFRDAGRTETHTCLVWRPDEACTSESHSKQDESIGARLH
jgi:GNAT superfamily N-acetyltransferase